MIKTVTDNGRAACVQVNESIPWVYAEPCGPISADEGYVSTKITWRCFFAPVWGYLSSALRVFAQIVVQHHAQRLRTRVVLQVAPVCPSSARLGCIAWVDGSESPVSSITALRNVKLTHLLAEADIRPWHEHTENGRRQACIWVRSSDPGRYVRRSRSCLDHGSRAIQRPAGG